MTEGLRLGKIEYRFRVGIAGSCCITGGLAFELSEPHKTVTLAGRIKRSSDSMNRGAMESEQRCVRHGLLSQ